MILTQTYSIRVPCVYNRQQAWVSAVFSGPVYIYMCDLLYACVAKSTLCIRLCVSILKMTVYDYQISSALTHTSWEAVRWSTVAAYVLGACKLKESTAVGFPFAQQSTAGDSKEQTGEKTDKTGTSGTTGIAAMYIFQLFCSFLCYYCWTSCMFIGLSGLLLAPHEWLNPPSNHPIDVFDGPPWQPRAKQEALKRELDGLGSHRLTNKHWGLNQW